MSLNFSNNDKQVRQQILSRLRSEGLYYSHNLFGFDYKFVQYTRTNAPNIQTGGIATHYIGKFPSGRDENVTQYYLGDLQWTEERDSSGTRNIKFSLIDTIEDWNFPFKNSNIRHLYDVMFAQCTIDDVSASVRTYFTFSGVEITIY